MLILTRKLNQRIFIGNNREITVSVLNVQYKGGSYIVKLGIDADESIDVVREEVFLKRIVKEVEENIKESLSDEYVAQGQD